MGDGYDCWCCAAQRMAVLAGRVVGKRSAEILWVSDCGVRNCTKRGGSDCLIGHEIEGRW